MAIKTITTLAGQQQNSDWVDNKKSLENFVNLLASLFLCFLLIFLSACADNKRKTRKLCRLTYSLPLPCYCLWSSLFLHFHPFFVFPRWSALHSGIFSRLFFRIAPSGCYGLSEQFFDFKKWLKSISNIALVSYFHHYLHFHVN